MRFVLVVDGGTLITEEHGTLDSDSDRILCTAIAWDTLILAYLIFAVVWAEHGLSHRVACFTTHSHGRVISHNVISNGNAVL